MPSSLSVLSPDSLVPNIKAIPGNYTLTAADLRGNVVLAFDSSSACTLTIPSGLAATIPGTSVVVGGVTLTNPPASVSPAGVDVVQRGTGQVTISGPSVTIQAADGALKTRVQFSAATILRTATNTYHCSGDMVV